MATFKATRPNGDEFFFDSDSLESAQRDASDSTVEEVSDDTEKKASSTSTSIADKKEPTR